MWHMIAMMGVSAMMSIYQQRAQAKAQNQYALQNARNSIEAQRHANTAVNLRLQQEGDVTAQQKRKAALDGLRAESSFKAAGGATGNSVDRLQSSIDNQVGQMFDDMDYNFGNSKLQAEFEKKGIAARTQSRINQVPTVRYNPAVAALGEGLKIYTQAEGMKAAKGNANGRDYSWSDWAFS